MKTAKKTMLAKLSWKYINSAFGVSLYKGVMSDAVDV